MTVGRGALQSSGDVVAALDLGGTKLASALFADEGGPHNKRVATLDGRGGAAVGGLVAEEVQRLAAAADDRGFRLRGVGICVPGIVSGGTGRVWAPNIPGWDDYPLRDEMEAAVADGAIRVVVTNDRAASILGEVSRGAARGCRHAIFLAVGTGIGAGILCDGRVIDGAAGIAGAIGWWALDRLYQPAYETCGCFESHSSGEGLARQVRAALTQHPDYQGRLRTVDALTTRDLFDAYDSGDALAWDVINDAIEFWAMASANLVSIFNPEAVIFGGGVFGPATKFIDRIYDEARRWAQPIAMDQVKFAASELGGDAALCGVAFLAREG